MLTPQEAQELFEIVRSLTDAGQVDHLHQPQAERGARDRRPDHRAPARQEDRHAPGGGRDRGGPRAADGRPRGAAPGRQARRRRPASRCSRSRTCTVLDDRGLEAVRGVSFEVRGGEIVGIAGVDGNGQTELIDAITGLREVAAGRVRRRRRGRHRRRARATASTPGSATSRRTGSAAGSCSTSRSPRTSRSTTTDQPPDSRFGWLYPERVIVARARRLLKEFDVRGGGPQTPRGGALGRQPAEGRRSRARSTATRSVLIAAQPTRGLDVGAIEFVHRRLVEERDEGRAVLLVSLELDEILSLSDRILVIYEGEIVGEFPPDVYRGGARHRDDRRRPRRRRRRERAAARAVRSSRAPSPSERAADGAARRLRRALRARAEGRRARRAAPDRASSRSSSAASSSSSRPGKQPARDVPGDLRRHRAATGSSGGSYAAIPSRTPRLVPVERDDIDDRGDQPPADADH